MLRTTHESLGERQPASLDGRFWIAADARLDGRAEFISELQRAGRAVRPKAPDSELILEAYATWGTPCVERLRGDFSFAVWDARNKQLFVARIPDGERKIAPQALHARRAPSGIGFENQFRVRSFWPDGPAGALQLGDEFRPAIESRVRGNPKPPIETRRLAFAERFVGGPQHCVTQPDRTIQHSRESGPR